MATKPSPATPERIYEIAITLRSGKEIIFDANKYSIKSDGITLTSFSWTTPPDNETYHYRALGYIDIRDVVAIVIL